MEISDWERALLGDVWTAPALWENIAYLCDECHGRFAGSDDERRAGDYLLMRLAEYGLQRVAAESFEMPGWQRGEESLHVLNGDGAYALPCMALAGSPAAVVEAGLVDVGPGTPADFARLGPAVAGQVVLTGPEGPHRLERYVAAQEAGASGILYAGAQPGLFVSAGSLNLRTMEPRIPSVGVPVETTAFLRRRLAQGPQRVRVTVGGGRRTVTARNIVAELPGADAEAGWVVACAHYDGHDIAQGAQDNASGTAVVLETARLLAPLAAHLRAGLRFIFFSGEELGMHGSYAYVRDHSDEMGTIRAVFNADIVGIIPPLLMHTQHSPELAAYLRRLPLEELDATVDDTALFHNSDHFPFTLAGVSSLMAVSSPAPPERGWVHTVADTLDKLDVRALRQAAATSSRLLLRMAAGPELAPHARKTPEAVRQAVTAAGHEKILRLQGRWPF